MSCKVERLPGEAREARERVRNGSETTGDSGEGRLLRLNQFDRLKGFGLHRQSRILCFVCRVQVLLVSIEN